MPLTPTKYKIEYQDKTMKVKLLGEIDHHSAKSVRAVIDEEMLKARPIRLEMDLSGVDFMDSSGLGLILGRMSKAEEIGCRVIITNASERVYKILDLAGVGRLITIERKK